jgi:hypothetical protein
MGTCTFNCLVDNSLRETLSEGETVVCKFCHFKHRGSVSTSWRLSSKYELISTAFEAFDVRFSYLLVRINSSLHHRITDFHASKHFIKG